MAPDPVSPPTVHGTVMSASSAPENVLPPTGSSHWYEVMPGFGVDLLASNRHRNRLSAPDCATAHCPLGRFAPEFGITVKAAATLTTAAATWTVRVCDRPWYCARISADPAPIAATSHVGDTVATAALLDDHAALDETFCVEPSLRPAVAVHWADCPGDSVAPPASVNDESVAAPAVTVSGAAPATL